eukprot:jgi/Bigna1/85178/estExt_fgenesh1_pg.C_20376
MEANPGQKRTRDGVPNGQNGTSNGSTSTDAAPKTRKRRRWGVKPEQPAAPPVAPLGVQQKAQQADLIRQQIAASLAKINLPGIGGAIGGGMGGAIRAPMMGAGIPGMGGMGIGGMRPTPGFGAGSNFTAGKPPSGFHNVNKPKWVPLRLDAKGRQIDEQGNVIKMSRETTATLKVNQKREMLEQKKLEPTPQLVNKKLKHLDPRITVAEKRSITRRRKALMFVKKGKFQRKAQAMRMEQISQQLRQDRVVSKKVGGSQDASMIPARPIQVDELPDIEWWDERTLGQNKTYDDFTEDMVPSTITLKVHHPVPLAPPCEVEPPGPRALLLTKKERKKIRRMNKLEKERERQDLVSAGMIPAKEPRLKLSNMMAILMDEAVADPSAVEKKVRAQMAKRAQAHLEHNASRKLSKQAKSEKLRKKLQEDTRKKSEVTIYLAPDLSSKQVRFKIDANANQYNMTGVGVISDIANVVVLEGGPKGTKKFKGLMMRRIKWQTDEAAEMDDDDDDDSDYEYQQESSSKTGAKLIWQGIQSQRKFLNFRFETCSSEASARKFFADKGLEHYWDQALNAKTAGTED